MAGFLTAKIYGIFCTSSQPGDANRVTSTTMPTLSIVPHEPVPAPDWRVWLQEHGPKLMLFARQQTRSTEDAEDVFQDALVKLTEKIRLEEFTGGEEGWLPYLYATIRRLAIDLSRKDDRRKRREDFVGGEVAGEDKTPVHPWFDSDASDDEVRSQLEQKLKELPEKFSEVIVLKVWGEQTFAEIGETLEISQNTAASRYRYGLEMLRKSLSNARSRGDL